MTADAAQRDVARELELLRAERGVVGSASVAELLSSYDASPAVHSFGRGGSWCRPTSSRSSCLLD